MFLIREIVIEIVGSNVLGILTACAFTIIFPMIEWLWVYYDCGELFFFLLATFLAIKGYWLGIILIAPIAEYNKESFLFFLVALFPFLEKKFGKIKIATILTFAIFFSGIVYLYVFDLYFENPGGSTAFQLLRHFIFIFKGWTDTEITYGEFFGFGMFLPHVFFIFWIVKCTWKNLSSEWKKHIKIVTAINIPLYLLFCYPGELRNFSLLYIGFIAMLSIFIKEAIHFEQKI